MSSEVPARRRFINWFLGTSAGALAGSILLPILSFLRPPVVAEAATTEVEAGSVNDPEFLERGFKIVPLGAEPVIVVRLSEGEFRALGATCTHLDCIVEYRADQNVIWCNCHDGRFDLSGHNIAGPPPRPLEQYRVHVVQRRPGQPGTVVVSRA
jgi:Rieske Fe-S protein